MTTLTLTPLAEFLTYPELEASPAWELLHGVAGQKPMPTLFHSRLQTNLVNFINRHRHPWEAVAELRCLVPPDSPVPDIVVARSDRLSEDGPLEGAPDWLIEIRSPQQSMLRLQGKILHCLAQGTALAWLIDGDRQQVWVWQGEELPNIYSGEGMLPVLPDCPPLTVAQVMAMTQRRRPDQSLDGSDSFGD